MKHLRDGEGKGWKGVLVFNEGKRTKITDIRVPL